MQSKNALQVRNCLLTDEESTALKNSLMFLHVSELKYLAVKLYLVDKGNKMALIMRILHFLHTGKKLAVPKFPENSRAMRGQIYPIHSSALMLKGSYKNDLKTRLFFKQLLGDHFHFTAYGIDWLNERWMQGNPPTYQEFASMWQEEHERRKNVPAAPKEEWAYINFVQKFLQNSLEASRECINHAWECERQKHKANINAWLEEKKLVIWTI